jgi:hypothetical protein
MTMPFDDVQVITVNIPGDRGPAGPQGIPGPANVLTIGTVSTGAAGSSASATLSGVAPAQTLNLTIPQGIQGAVGPANTLTIGTVTTVASTTGGSATITGTAPNQTLNLVIPRGYGVSPGGAAGDVVVKNTATDYDVSWATPTSAATANALVKRDANARIQAADPSATADVATKNYIDNTAGTNLNTASALVRRASTGTIQVGEPTSTSHAATKNYVDTQDTTTLNSARRVSLNTVATTAYTFALTDEGKSVQYTTDNSAVTYTIPTNATVAFPIGAFIDVWAGGTGAVTINPAAGVTLRGPDGTASITLRNIYSKVRLTKVNTDSWVFMGDSTNLSTTLTTNSTASATAGTLAKRDASGRAQFADPSAAQDAATKNYVDNKLTSRTGTSTIDDSAGAATDNVLILKSPASYTGAFIKLNSGGTDYLNVVLSTSSLEPTLYNPRTATTNQAIQLANTNGALRILPYNDANVYVQSTLSGLVFSGLNNTQGAGTVEFNYANAKFDGPVQVGGKITNVTDPTSAQDAATKAYVDAHAGGAANNVVVLATGASIPAGTPANSLIVRY